MSTVISIVNTKKISKKNTQKEVRRESKWYTTKNQIHTKGVSE